MTPNGWKSARFAEIVEYKAGRTPARARADYWRAAGDGVPWVAISDMSEFGTLTETKERISATAFQQVFRGQTVPAGTLIMSFKLTIGRVATLGVDACHNEAIISIYPKHGVDQRYLGYFLSQVDYGTLQDRQVKGNTLNQEKIDRIEILLPRSDEQFQIANVLDLIRKGIGVEEDAVATSERLKRAAMQMLYALGLRGELQKETEIGLVPEGWRVEPLGGHIKPPDYGFTASASSERVGPRLLRITDIQGGRVTWDTVPYCDCDVDSLAAKRLHPNDIVVARIGATTGKAFLITDCPEAVFASYLIRIRTREQSLAPEFLYYFMQSEPYWLHINQHKGGRLKGGVNVPILSSLPVPIPPRSEQHEIVTILSAIDRKIDLHRRKRDTLDDLFKALLHKLMTGEIRVADLALSALTAAPKTEMAIA